MIVVVSLTVDGRLVNRLGPGAVAALGGLLFAVGATIWLWRLGPVPDYVGGLLPGQLFTGAGVGLVMPILSGVVGLVLPPARWRAGSSTINTARQIGTMLGTAVVVVIYGATLDLDAFRRGWIFVGRRCWPVHWPDVRSRPAGTPPMRTGRLRPWAQAGLLVDEASPDGGEQTF